MYATAPIMRIIENCFNNIYRLPELRDRLESRFCSESLLGKVSDWR